jgi:hypothetical protein
MYISIQNLANKYDIHPDTIRRQELIEGIHYIRINKMKRYDIKEMHKLLVSTPINNSKNKVDSILSNFLIEN